MTNLRTLAALLIVSVVVGPVVFADEPKPAEQVRDQKDALAHAEQTARRIQTSLRVMAYQKTDAGAEQKLLDEVAVSLRGLSQDQIKAVLNHLEAAVKAPDEKTATEQQKQAYVKHRHVVSSLRGMLVKLDALKSLDQAATRIARMSEDERQLHEKSLRAGSFRPTNRSIYRKAVDDREEQADSQGDLKSDLTTLVKQLGRLKSSLNPEQKERLDKADVFGRSGRIMADMEVAAASLQSGSFTEASERQMTVAKELQNLAAALRTPRDKLTELREARSKLDQLAKAQDELKVETNDAAKNSLPMDRDPQQFSRKTMDKQDPAKVQAHQLADKQDKLEFDSREVRKKLEALAPDVAAKISPAEAEQKKAQDDLRKEDLDRATDPQQIAAEKLATAREALDKLIEKMELQKSDPLAAVKKAAEMVDKLLAEQKKVREETAKEQDADKLKPAANAQKDVAKKTDEVKHLPLPENMDLKEALDKAADATKKASEDLAAKDKPAAQPKQDAAVKALEEAKKALEEKAKEIEKRREDLAKLDEAAKKLEDLKKKEDAVAKDAGKNKDDVEKNKETAKNQEKITPPTKDVGEMVKDIAPEATDKIKESAKAQEQAKKDLDKNMAEAGEKQSKDAAKKLDEAKDALAKKTEELKAKEIADQAALQPKQVDPQAAAEQLAKAIENAKEAAKQADKAAEQQKDLAKAQKELAEKADKANQPEAAKDAAAAAKALEKGDIPEAVENQKKALDKLAKAEPMKGEKGEKAESPMKGEKGAKGEKDEKGEAGEKGEPKGGDPKAGEPGDLAQEQKQLKEATEALQKSQAANQAAQAALNQAQAQAPQAVKPQLDQAAKQLSDAQKQLAQGKPSEAGQNQTEAAQQLEKALGALNAAAQANGQPGQQPGQPMDAQSAKGEGDQPGEPGDKPGKPGDKPGKPGNKPGQPGQQQAKGDQPGEPGQPNPMKGDGPEKNEGVAEGNREGPGQMKNTASRGKSSDADGTFIQLQKKEREKVQQNAEMAFPAEFRELIKQYNINIKNLLKPQGKPEEKK